MFSKKATGIPVGEDVLQPRPMVKWYDLRMLSQTAYQVVVSNLFGKYADTRETFSRSKFPAPLDYSSIARSGALWLDYIADTGDGFNSTYSIASLLSKKEWKIKDEHGTEQYMQQGNILVMGGDEVYPAASYEDYLQRLWLPFECANPAPKDLTHESNHASSTQPDLYAIPGNHDWYDGLNNFLKFFCQKRQMGAWQTRQERSYFAAKLYDNLWIWGIDIQLEGGIDKLQLDYFHTIATEHMHDRDRLILCTAEPAWVHINTKAGKKRFAKLNFFIRDCIEQVVDAKGNSRNLNLVLLLSGDLHHYAHYQPVNKKDYHNLADHCITAGGGGAFLHPTHNLSETLDFTVPQTTLANQSNRQPHTPLIKGATFPSSTTSRNICFRNLLFGWYNVPLTFLLTAILLLCFLLTQSWSIVRTELNDISYSCFSNMYHQDLLPAWTDFMYSLLITPAACLLLMLFLGGVYTFRDKEQGVLWKNALLGVVHGLTHFLSGSWLMTVLVQLVFSPNSLSDANPAFYLVITTGYLIMGYILHALIFSCYLLIANLLLKCHDNEAFSHLAIADYKNIIKLKISDTGKITVYPIGVKRICKKWKKTTAAKSTTERTIIEPEQPIQYELIEKPFHIDSNPYFEPPVA
jgi:hypothetical protein